MRRTIFKKIFTVFLYVFAGIGFVFTGVFVLMQFGGLNVKGSISKRNEYFNTSSVKDASISGVKERIMPVSSRAWAQSSEWSVMKEAFIRDKESIIKASHDAGIPPRVLLGGVIGEQFRFFTSSRDSFKTYFEPLKILASLSKFSFGIAGLKPQTVEKIEAHLKDSSSPFYLGADMENILDYAPGTISVAQERMNRITDSKNPYYSYLYVGLYMRQIMVQWQRAGYDISNRPDILATLYNLGFYYSRPNPEPMAGGAEIVVNEVAYTFGDLAYEFYYSSELSDIFGDEVQ